MRDLSISHYILRWMFSALQPIPNRWGGICLLLSEVVGRCQLAVVQIKTLIVCSCPVHFIDFSFPELQLKTSVKTKPC